MLNNLHLANTNMILEYLCARVWFRQPPIESFSIFLSESCYFYCLKSSSHLFILFDETACRNCAIAHDLSVLRLFLKDTVQSTQSLFISRLSHLKKKKSRERKHNAKAVILSLEKAHFPKHRMTSLQNLSQPCLIIPGFILQRTALTELPAPICRRESTEKCSETHQRSSSFSLVKISLIPDWTIILTPQKAQRCLCPI